MMNDLARAMRRWTERKKNHSHVLTTFLDPVLGAMLKQVCWHSRRSKANRDLLEARSKAHGDSNHMFTVVGVPKQ